ncbi:hypothetical protein IF1G_11381 [Cordyceps javanica]|uniref:Uncharacterized protein n=1 Tax=Cordyceps javanica TaxID=43265 RepID=A0A545UKG4_9HYPO|nr:hypothetical protein IF1G_11381 [Cordyceps javanica]
MSDLRSSSALVRSKASTTAAASASSFARKAAVLEVRATSLHSHHETPAPARALTEKREVRGMSGPMRRVDDA